MSVSLSIPTNLINNGNAVTSASDVTASFTPAGGSLILASNTIMRATGVPTSIAVSDSFGGTIGAWTTVATVVGSATRSAIVLAWALASASPSSGTVTFTYSGGAGNPIRKAWIIDQVLGFKNSAPIVQSATNTSLLTTLSISLAAITGTNMTYGVVDGPSSSAITPGTNEVEIIEISSGGASNANLQSEYGILQDATVDWSNLQITAVDNLGIAVEIARAPVGTGNFFRMF